jgi:hypothetical protein
VIASFAVLSLLLTTLSVNAIVSSSRDLQKIKDSLSFSEPITPIQNDINVDPENRIWLTGDSVILGIRVALSEIKPVTLVNARVGRAAPELLSEMSNDIANASGFTLVFNLGNNDSLKEETVRAILELVKSNPRVIVVNTAVPRPYRDSNNELLSQLVLEYSNVRLVDWNALSESHPEYFAPDGVHLVPTGVSAYVAAIAAQL